MSIEPKPEDKSQNEPEVDPLIEPEVVLEEPTLETESAPNPADKQKVHPLQPGGARFEQIYAKGKQTERDLAATREQLAALEAKFNSLKAGGNTDTENAEYTPAQLDEFVRQGRISQADATAHLLEIHDRKTEKRILEKIKGETSTATRLQTLQSGIGQYVKAVPAILVEGSEDRVRLDEEFDFLTSAEGLDPLKINDTTRTRIQLTALRTVYGPIDSLQARSTPQRVDTQQELPGGVRKTVVPNPDQALLNSLTKSEVVHYNKMFRAGRYPGGWKDVVAELKFQAPKKASR